MADKWVIVTGATGAIGAALAEQLAGQGLGVVLACRNPQRGISTARDILARHHHARLRTMELDLERLDSVARFTEEVRAAGLPLTALVNNAATMRRDYSETAEGFETTIGVNYVATCLLNRMMLPLLREHARIVNTISCTARLGRIDEHIFARRGAGHSRLKAYTSSKLALWLDTVTLAEECSPHGVQVLAADPGIVNTPMISMGRWYDPLADLFFRPLIRTPQAGAEAALRAVTDPTLRDVGVVHRRSVAPTPSHIRSHHRRLWLRAHTEAFLKQKGIHWSTPPQRGAREKRPPA